MSATSVERPLFNRPFDTLALLGDILLAFGDVGHVAELVGIEGGVVSG